jgi:hypothetical protein
MAESTHSISEPSRVVRETLEGGSGYLRGTLSTCEFRFRLQYFAVVHNACSRGRCWDIDELDSRPTKVGGNGLRGGFR